MKILGAIAMLAALSAATIPAIAQASTGPLLLVANQGDRTLSLIDPATEKQIAAIPVGGITGHEVVASPDGRFAYVPIYGDSGVGRAGTDGSTMAIIDLPARKVVGNVDFGHGVRPHKPIYDPATGLLYVTTELDKAITILDPRPNPAAPGIIGTVPTGQEQSHMLILSHDGSRGYTANVGPGTVSVLDMRARKLIAVIPISAHTQRISISPDDKTVFTADQTKPQIAVIDTATNKVKDWIPLPAVGYATATTLDGRWLLVPMVTLKQVAVIDLATRKVTHTLDIPGGDGAVLMRPDGKVAYVSCSPDNHVAVIDLSTWKVTNLIQAGTKADGLAWAK